jgi:hypothetical protein
MRHWILGAVGMAALFLCPKAQAAISNTYLVTYTSMTVTAVAVSTSTATQMDANLLPSRSAISIEDIVYEGGPLWCSPNKTQAAVNTGFEIADGATWTWGLGGDIPIYCLYQGSSAGTVIVIQSR